MWQKLNSNWSTFNVQWRRYFIKVYLKTEKNSILIFWIYLPLWKIYLKKAMALASSHVQKILIQFNTVKVAVYQDPERLLKNLKINFTNCNHKQNIKAKVTVTLSLIYFFHIWDGIHPPPPDPKKGHFPSDWLKVTWARPFIANSSLLKPFKITKIS